jgi:hypothetical protein
MSVWRSFSLFWSSRYSAASAELAAVRFTGPATMVVGGLGLIIIVLGPASNGKTLSFGRISCAV